VFKRKTIKIFLADRHPQFLEGFTKIFRYKPIEILGQAKTREDLFDGLQSLRPDLLITAHRLLDEEADNFLPAVKEKFPGVKILLFTMNCHKEVLLHHIQHLDGMICKSAHRKDVWKAISEITRNNAQFFHIDGHRYHKKKS
jgi:DNA-binding NarL/FixJ family response regulator